DVTDIKILNILSSNAKLRTKEIAAQVGLSVTPVFERIKRMERSGVIQGYRAQVNREAIGKNIMAICSISLNQHKTEFLRKFEKEIVDFEEVSECLHVAGQFDYLLRIMTPSMESYRNFVTEKLASLNNISQVNSSFVMTEVKAL
ncbi:MAG: Lrp/AsnC family transcriptional regulator, partial [Bacteroidota bacterium]